MDKRMNILLVDLGRELRGGQLQVLYLARLLARRDDISVLTACPRNSALAVRLKNEDLPLLPLPGRSPFNPFLLGVMEYAIRSRHINIIHTHDANAATLGALFKACHPRLKLIHSRRVSYPLRKGLRQWKYRKADMVVGVSADISKGMINAGMPPERVRTVHSGIDPSFYVPKIPRSDGRFVFQSVGAFTPQKGYSVLIKAMSILQEMEDLPPWEVRIVGDGPLFQSILQEAFDLHVDARLALLGRQDSRIVLPMCDVLIVPSTDGEGSSGAIKEGWVTGVPVICSSLASNLELVEDKRNGLVTPVGNPLALAAAMARCLTEPALNERLSENGTASVSKFTDDRMASAYALLYAELMGN